MFSKLSLSQKMISIIVLLLVCVFTIIALFISKQVGTGVFSLQKATVTRETSILTDMVELMVDEQKEIVSQSAIRTMIREELKEKKDFSQSTGYIQNVNKRKTFYEYSFLADENGKILVSSDPELVGKPINNREWWKELSATKSVIYEPHPVASSSGDPISIVAAAVKDENGAFLGAFGTAVNIKTLADLYITDIQIGKGGYPYLVTDRGVVIAHPDKNTVGQDISSFDFIKEVISNETGFQNYVWKGERKIQSYKKVRNIPWYICINTPKNELVALANSLTLMVTIISIISVVLLSVIVYMVINSVVLKRFHKFGDVFGMGSKGDLTVRVTDSNKDELGLLAQQFNGFVSNIQNLMKDLLTSITEMSSYSEELSATATEMASTSEELSSQSSVVASSSEQSTANVNTISSAAEQMSSNLESVAISMEELTASVTEDAKSTQRESHLAREAQDAADKTVTTMNRLETAAQKIGKVVELIRDIADQTNLLALNATIEAASAGEAGKGFAVVANEVKELAKQSSQATDEIAVQISDIQSSTLDAVEAIKGITTKINEVNSISEMIASSIEEQTATVQEAAKNITEASGASSEIARNVSESARGLQEISSNIQGVNSAVANTSEAASNVERRSNDLSRMSKQLSEKIKTFKV